MKGMDLLYTAALRGARLVSPALARGDSKVARGIRGRRDAVSALVRWGRSGRDPERPVVWLHAPSVGEGLQARAVLEALREARPDIQAVFTHFSPSAEGLAGRMPADVAAYLPWDLPGDVAAVLDAVRPGVVAFTKTEVWPTLTRMASARGSAVALVAGTVPPGARRDRPLARALLGPTWRALDLACAVGRKDADRLRALGVPPDRITVTGDPGIDSAHARAHGADPDAPWLRPFHQRPAPTLVAGSTWPADEAVLLPALRRVRDDVPELRIVVAPHEPHPDVVAELIRRLAADGWTAATLARVEEVGDPEDVNAVVVERVGVLAHLYTVGSVAYVGGGFHDDGLHSVLEPAAAGLPVLFGPRHHNARAAGEIEALGGARVVRGSEELADAATRWLTDDEGRGYAGARAFGYIHAHLGAARRTAALLIDLLDDRQRRSVR